MEAAEGEGGLELLKLRYRLPSPKPSSGEGLTDANFHPGSLQRCSSWDPLRRGSFGGFEYFAYYSNYLLYLGIKADALSWIFLVEGEIASFQDSSIE